MPCQPTFSHSDCSTGKKAVCKLRKFSVTITSANADLNVDLHGPRVNAWCGQECQEYYFGVEREDVLQQKHLQGVIALMTTCALVVTRRLRDATGFNAPDTEGHTVISRELKGTGLHTFNGMCGYCSKDAGLLHFQSFSKGVTRADFDGGRELYVQYGSPEEMKNRVILISTNGFHRAAVYQKFKA